MYNTANITSLKDNLNSFCELMDEFALHMRDSGRVLNVVEKYYNRHLNRTRMHLQSVSHLLDLYEQAPTFMVSIAQIVRVLLTDFLTAFYLHSFINTQEEGFVTFVNELHLLDRDAMRTIDEWIEIETELHDFNEHLLEVTEEESRRKKATFVEHFPHIFNEDGTIKSTFDIRSSSDRRLFYVDEDLRQPRTITERYKVNRLKRLPYFKMLDGYMLYKYFSQFYHEFKLYDYLVARESADDNFKYLRWAFIPVYFMTDTAILFFLEEDNEYSQKLGELKIQLESIGND